MSAKLSIFSILAINFVFLLATTNSPSWSNSPLYTQHLKKFNNSSPGLYCLELDQMSAPEEKQIQIDEQIRLLHYKKLIPTIPETHFKFNPRTPEKSINFFYAGNTTWEQTLRIGEDFLCKSQIYNHIPGSHKFSLNLQDSDTLASYKRLDLRKRVIEVHDLSKVEQCEEFFAGLEGNWYLKNHDSLAVLSVIRPDTVGFFKTGAKCPLFNRFAVKKFPTSEFVQSHFVVVFVEPLRVYYTDATYEFEFNNEAIKKDIIEESLGVGTLKKLKDEVEMTLWHYFKANLKKVLNHPGTFEMFKVKFVVDHDYFPWLFDIVNFQTLANQKMLNQDLQIALIDLAYLELLGIEDRYLESDLFTRI